MTYLNQIETALGALPIALQGTEPLPLALGSREALQARLEAAGLSADEACPLAGRALSRFCQGPAYRNAVAVDQSPRVDLDGVPVGMVSESDRLAAAMVLLAHATRAALKGHKPKPEAEPAPAAPASRYPPAPRRSPSDPISVRARGPRMG